MFHVFAPSRYVGLPSEDIGNTDKMQASLTTHRVLSGALTTYKRVDSFNTKTYSFTSVPHKTYLEFISLIQESQARVIIFEDSSGLSFTGKLSPGNIEMVSERESGGIIYRNFRLNIKGAANA